MKNRRQLFGFLCGLSAGFCAFSPSLAQVSVEPTPRQIFVSFITDTPVSELRFKPLIGLADEPAPVETPPAPFQNILPGGASDIDVPDLDIFAPKDVAEDTLERDMPVAELEAEILSNDTVRPEALSEIEPETVLPNIEPDKSKDIQDILDFSKPIQSAQDIQIQPFYVSAKNYVSARGDKDIDQVILDYEVVPVNPLSGLKADPKKVRLIIAPDFASVTREGKTRIFDFKMKRLLTLRPGASGQVFDNYSLFPIALKNMETIQAATQNGKLANIQVGPETSLAAFWMEASLGWSARSDIPDLNVDMDGSSVSVTYADRTPLKARFNGPVLLSEAYRVSLFAFLHHDVAIHPVVLREMGPPIAVPDYMKVLSFSPNYPDGLETVWTLEDSETVSRPFPLPSDTQSAIAAEQGSPVNYVIYKHVQAGGDSPQKSHDGLRQAVFDANEAGNEVAAWLNAKDLENRLGDCTFDPALLCEDIEALEANALPGSKLGKLIAAYNARHKPSKRVQSFKVMSEYLTDGTAPAFLLKAGGQTRALIKTEDLKDEALKSLRAGRLLQEALVKNPGDAETYRSLSQVYAAQRRYVESWDLQDALRRMPDVPDELTDPINRVEKSLLQRVPAFFIPNSL